MYSSPLAPCPQGFHRDSIARSLVVVWNCGKYYPCAHCYCTNTRIFNDIHALTQHLPGTAITFIVWGVTINFTNFFFPFHNFTDRRGDLSDLSIYPHLMFWWCWGLTWTLCILGKCSATDLLPLVLFIFWNSILLSTHAGLELRIFVS